jgi:uncharacterized protein YqjF (DUF2071 family)
MRWDDLLFAHWPIDAELIRPLIPEGLEIETYDGKAWIGIVPFAMCYVRPRFIPAFSFYSDFLELNVRTYVTRGGKRGVWFFSLDAASKLAVRVARAAFCLPYFDADMSLTKDRATVIYSSKRTHKNAPHATLEMSYRPTSEVFNSREGTFEHWATERYCLYSANSKGTIFRGEIHHQKWSLQEVEVEFTTNEMLALLNIDLPNETPKLHFSKSLEVAAWAPTSC